MGPGPKLIVAVGGGGLWMHELHCRPLRAARELHLISEALIELAGARAILEPGQPPDIARVVCQWIFVPCDT
jgi:hypothetical protein